MKRKSFLKYSLSLTVFASLKTSRLFAFYIKSQKLFANKVKFLWTGAVTTNSIKVVAKLTTPTTSARLVVSTSQSMNNPIYGNFAIADVNNNYLARLSVNGLQANTQYYYQIEADGIIDTATDALGKFNTIKNNFQSFTITVGSCSANNNHPVFLRIKEKDPFIHITHGDLHYSDPNSSSDINVHRQPYENTLVQPSLRTLLQNSPIAYMWDDHDFSGDDSSSFNAGKINARLAYQEYVPHFSLPAGTGNVPIYQSFVVGRIIFILTDLRSERIPGSTMMGITQRTWFENVCLNAKNNNQIIVWLSSVSWGGSGGDSWGGYVSERTYLANFFRDANIRNLIIICGDAHMIAVDNGTNHDFSSSTNNPNKYPVIQAAALNQNGSYKGGIFSQGYFLNPDSSFGQYAKIGIIDNGGDKVTFEITGYRVDAAGIETTLLTSSFTFSLLTVLPISFVEFSVESYKNGSKSFLEWAVVHTLNAQCESMSVHRSNDGANFYEIGIIDCKKTSDQTVYYNFVDESPLYGKNFYKVVIRDKNNILSHSGIKALDITKGVTVKTVNNPVKDNLRLLIQSHESISAECLIRDINSRIIKRQKMGLQQGLNYSNINVAGFGKGVYLITLNIDRLQFTDKFIVE